MKTIILTLFICFTLSPLFAQFNMLYQHWDEYPDGNSSIKAVAADNSGNSFMAGNFSGTLTLGAFTLTNPTNSTGYYGKFNNASSTWTWSKKINLVTTSGTLAYISTCDIRDAAADGNGNLYLIGSYIGSIKFDNITLSSTKTNGSFVYYDMYVAKISANGICVWAKSFGTKNGSDFGQALGLDTAGNVYFNAEFGKEITCSGFSHFQFDLTFSKLNNAGTQLWQKQYATSMPCENQSANSGAIFVDPSGNSYVTGEFVGTVNFGTGTGFSISSSGLSDLYVAKINTSGTTQWVRSTGQPATSDRGSGIYVDGSGNVYVGGSIGDNNNNISSVLSKYNSFGSLSWSTDPFPYSSSQGQGGVLRIVPENGNLLVAHFKVGFKTVSMTNGSILASDSITGNSSTGLVFIRDLTSSGTSLLAGTDDHCGIAQLGNLALAGSCSDCNNCPGVSANIQLITRGNGPAIMHEYPDESKGISSRSTEPEIHLYPNPSSYEFIIATTVSEGNTSIVHVYNALGQIMQAGVVSGKEFHFGRDYQPGLYYAEITIRGERKIMKLLKTE